MKKFTLKQKPLNSRSFSNGCWRRFIISKISIAIVLAGLSMSNTSMRTVSNTKYFDVVNDAISSIQKTLKEEGSSPYLICRTYEIAGENLPVSATTRTHYREYRKKSSYDKKTFSESLKPATTIEFVYNSNDKNHLTQIRKKPNLHSKEKTKIDFPTSLDKTILL